MLRNTSYRGIFEKPVQLVDGRYEGEPFDPQGISRPILIYQTHTWGKLDSDNNDDAAVILVATMGGSGSFYQLAAVLNRLGKPVNAATISLGDRVQIRSLRIEDRVITIQMIAHAPNDPLCCPSMAVTVRYRLQGETLVKVN